MRDGDKVIVRKGEFSDQRGVIIGTVNNDIFKVPLPVYIIKLESGYQTTIDFVDLELIQE